MEKILFIILIICQSAFGKEDKYPVSAIPENLKQNTNTVIRESQTTYTIISKNEARYKVSKALTILNEYGKSHAIEFVLYDNHTKISSFSGTYIT